MNKETLTEQYRRTDFETSKLLKKVEFDEECYAFYLDSGYYFNQSSGARNSYYNTYIAAPLIDVVLEWLKQKGYWYDFTSNPHPVLDGKFAEAYFMFNMDSISDNKIYDTEREFQLDYIRTVCNHILTTKD